MAMKNKIKDFIKRHGISVYEFRKKTGISNRTAYDLANRSDQYPSREVMDKICSAFKAQPSDLLEWIDSDRNDSMTQ
jgi:DNA-binding Xre family transcriptional regulator